jgi:hypothetical protein
VRPSFIAQANIPEAKMATLQQVRATLQGTLNALRKPTPKQLENLSAADFGEEYNKVRQLALDLYPDLKNVMPPAVVIVRGLDTMAWSRYGEIEVYCEQIDSLLVHPPPWVLAGMPAGLPTA